jgi:integrase
MAKDKVVRHTLADGSVKEYRYEAEKLYTVGDLITDYRTTSPEFKRLAPSTRDNYERAFRRVLEFQDVAVAEIRRRHILGQRNALSGKPGAANVLIGVWSVLMVFALDNDRIIASPAYKIKPLPLGEHRRWPDAAVDYALSTFKDEGSVKTEWARRAVLLGLYTGQRVSDIVRMRWSDYEAGGIRLVQQKTGKTLWVPAHAVLRAELAIWKAEARAVTILQQTRAPKPWTREVFSVMFSTLLDDHPALDGLVFHGLRKAAASRLAEAGCTEHEIAAITGQGLAEVQRYTREASQKVNASAAILKLERKTGHAND